MKRACMAILALAAGAVLAACSFTRAGGNWTHGGATVTQSVTVDVPSENALRLRSGSSWVGNMVGGVVVDATFESPAITFRIELRGPEGAQYDPGQFIERRLRVTSSDGLALIDDDGTVCDMNIVFDGGFFEGGAQCAAHGRVDIRWGATYYEPLPTELWPEGVPMLPLV